MGEAKRRVTFGKFVDGEWTDGEKFISHQIGIRNVVRDQWKKDCSSLHSAYRMALSAVIHSVNRKISVPGLTSESISQRLSLSASFIQGVDYCKEAISDGLYLQAAALLRQEMETLAAINENQKGERKNKKTPNVKHLPNNLQRLYGDLSQATHVADNILLHHLLYAGSLGAISGVSMSPIYNYKVSRYYFSVQIALLLLLACHIQELYKEMYGEEDAAQREQDLINKAGKLLEQCGDITVPILDIDILR